MFCCINHTTTDSDQIPVKTDLNFFSSAGRSNLTFGGVLGLRAAFRPAHGPSAPGAHETTVDVFITAQTERAAVLFRTHHQWAFFQYNVTFIKRMKKIYITIQPSNLTRAWLFLLRLPTRVNTNKQ